MIARSWVWFPAVPLPGSLGQLSLPSFRGKSSRYSIYLPRGRYLPCGLGLGSESGQTSNMSQAENNISQGSVATCSKCGGIFSYHLRPIAKLFFSTFSLKDFVKIWQYLMKLWQNSLAYFFCTTLALSPTYAVCDARVAILIIQFLFTPPIPTTVPFFIDYVHVLKWTTGKKGDLFVTITAGRLHSFVRSSINR